MSKLLSLPIGSIVENKVRLRDVQENSEDFKSLVANIKQLGLINPISVQEKKGPDGNTFYELIDGAHRFAAIRSLALLNPEKYSKIDCKVEEAMSMSDVAMRQIAANVNKIETKPAAYARQLLMIMHEHPTMTRKELAQLIGQSEAFVGQRLGLTTLDPKYDALVNEGKIKLQSAFALSKLSKDDQIKFVEKAITKTAEEFVAEVMQYNKDKNKALREGREVTEITFEARPKLRTIKEIESEIKTLAYAKTIDTKDPIQAFKMGVEWTLSMDKVTLKAKRDKFEADRKLMEQQKKEKEAKRAADRLAKEQAKVEEAQKHVQTLKAAVKP